MARPGRQRPNDPFKLFREGLQAGGIEGLRSGLIGKKATLDGPYEHHSNILPWRESGAEVIEIDEDPATGGPDLDVLRRTLEEALAPALLVVAFSAASNVTGVLTDVLAVTRVLQEYGAKSIWDYAGGGPYLPINMRPGRGVAIEAVSISPHKFIGGQEPPAC